MTAEPVTKFQAVPMAALPPEASAAPIAPNDTAPRRGRGRPPKDANAAPVTRRPRASKSLETQIGALLMTFNVAFYVIPPLQRDALDEAEIVALAKAIDQQAKVSPAFRRYLVAALEVTSGGQLLTVVAMIGARRLARHSFLLPVEADAQLGKLLAMGSGADAYTPPEPEQQDETADGTN